MLRRDPRTFLEGVIEHTGLSLEARERLLELSAQKAGAKRVAAIVAALETEPESDDA